MFGRAMLSSLKLSQFRCFENLRMELPSGISVITGPNAQGKTSILEAICVLLRLHSPRATRFGDLVRFEQRGFGLAGQWENEHLQVVQQHIRRRFYQNGEEVKRSRDYLDGSGRVVWMGNDDRQLITGTSSKRRRYLDFVASQLHASYRVSLRAYERCLRARNQLLKQTPTPPWKQVDAYTEVLVRHGTELTRQRREVVARLNPMIEAAHRRISASGEGLGLDYRSSSGEDLAQTLELSRQNDARAGQTTLGPHRDDLEVLINGKVASRFASEGQQRTIALALKLGQLEVLRAAPGKGLILLIDDVFGELDPTRRQALLNALPEDGQKIITTTSLKWLPEHRGLALGLFELGNGVVTRRGS